MAKPMNLATICKALREHFEGDGDNPTPLLVFQEGADTEAYAIDKIGHLHRVHRGLRWLSDAEELELDHRAAVERALKEMGN